MNNMIKKILVTATLTLSTLPIATAAQAGRYVVINGQRMTPRQLVAVDRANCMRIRNGRYWFNFYTKAWGYEGNPYPQGRVGAACYRRQTGTRFSRWRRPYVGLSQRGRLYYPGELLR